MNSRKLMIALAALALLSGAAVAGAVADNSTSLPAATTVCSDQDQQGENDEQEAAEAVDNAASEVSDEATTEQADDQAGDDQDADDQSDEQGENQDCDD
jgi:hypothetical protein